MAQKRESSWSYAHKSKPMDKEYTVQYPPSDGHKNMEIVQHDEILNNLCTLFVFGKCVNKFPPLIPFSDTKK